MRLGSASTPALPGVSAWLGTLALSLSGFALTTRLAPYSSVSPLTAYCVGFCLVVVSALGAAVSAPRQRPVCAMAALAGLVGWLCVGRVGADAWGGLGVFATLLALGSALGAWVGAGIEQPGHLLFVAIVSSAADLWSVGHPAGPSAQIARHADALVLLALPWPMLGTHQAAPLLGVGDVVFTSLYWSAARRHALPSLRTLLALLAGFGVTMLTVLLAARPVPVLPLLGVAMLAMHPAARRPHGPEARRAVWWTTAFALGLAVWVLQRAL
jgi:hypothetical protein